MQPRKTDREGNAERNCAGALVKEKLTPRKPSNPSLLSLGENVLTPSNGGLSRDAQQG